MASVPNITLQFAFPESTLCQRASEGLQSHYPSALQTFFSNMSMQHGIKKLVYGPLEHEHKQPSLSCLFDRVINNVGVQTGYSYLRWSSLAEKSLLCPARYWILALGTAPSAEAETGHIGSWLPQLSFSLINEKMKSFTCGAAMMKMWVQKQNKYFPSEQLPNERMILPIKCSFSHCFAPPF